MTRGHYSHLDSYNTGTELQIAAKEVQMYAETPPRPTHVTQVQAAEMLILSRYTVRKIWEFTRISSPTPSPSADHFRKPAGNDPARMERR